MTHEEFISLLRSPGDIRADLLPRLKEMTEQYPYFTSVRMLHLKGLQQTGDIDFEKSLTRAVLYAPDRRRLYYFLYPEKKQNKTKRHIRSEKNTGDYFGMLNAVEKEGEDVNKSLKLLAERLMAARTQIINEEPKKQSVASGGKSATSVGTPSSLDEYTLENYSEKVKKLIHEKKYEEALSILKKLNLNNPKKSIYFADQIRFVEKIIEHTKN